MKLVAYALASLLVAGPALAQSYTGALEDPNGAFAAQDRFIETIIQRDRRTSASICEKGCSGTLRRSGQPKDPFAPLVTYHPDTGQPMRPNGEILPGSPD